MNPNLNPQQFYHLHQGRAGAAGFNAVIAAENGNVVGNMTWGPGSSQIGSLWVHPEHRRQGVATQMWEHGQSVEPELKHHADRTDAGNAWAKSVSPGVSKRKHNSDTTEDVERRGAYSASMIQERLDSGDPKIRPI